MAAATVYHVAKCDKIPAETLVKHLASLIWFIYTLVVRVRLHVVADSISGIRA